MNEKSKPEQYARYIKSHILPFIDYYELQASYETDMVYAKGILTRLHESMVAVYGGERLVERDSNKGFVVIPGVLRGINSGNMCLALLELDLSSSGEHWGTDYLCKYGIISQDYNSALSDNKYVLKSEIKEVNAAYLPYDYCYTAEIPGDIHVKRTLLPDELKSVLKDFRNHRAELLFESEPFQDKSVLESGVSAAPTDKPASADKRSVLKQIREAAKAPKEPHKNRPDKSGPEL